MSVQELTLLFIIGLLVLGPQQLPRVASQIGRWVGRARRMANQLRYQLEREVALADLEKSSKKESGRQEKRPPDRKDDESAGDSGAAEDSSSSDTPDDRDHSDAGEAEPVASGDDVKQA